MSSAKRRHGEGKLVHEIGTEELMCCGKSLINKYSIYICMYVYSIYTVNNI